MCCDSGNFVVDLCIPSIQYFKHCATSRKVAGLIPDDVVGIFYWHNPSGRTMALRSTQSIRGISWG